MFWQNGQFIVAFGSITSVTLITRKGRIYPKSHFNQYACFASPKQLVLYMTTLVYKNKQYVTT